MKKTHAAVTGAIVATALAALLAGCSSQSPVDSPGPSATKSATASQPVNECKNGQLTVTDVKKSKDALAKGCDTISLLTSGADVEIGPTKTLGVEGSDNKVAGTTIGAVHAMGSGNAITYTGEAPDTEHLGEGNTAEAATH